MKNIKSCIVKTSSEIITNKNEIVFENNRVRDKNVDNIIKVRDRFKSKSNSTQKIEGKSFYAGICFNHFGHFLLESLSRLSNYEKNKYDQIIWCSRNQKFNMWQNEIIKILDLQNEKHVFITEDSKVEDLYLSKRGYVIWDTFKKEHSQYLQVVDKKTEKFENKKIWLSRLSKDIKNEFVIEFFLKKSGWLIINPEKYSVLEQASLFNNAKIVSGIEGSAFHTMVLSSECTNNVIIFNRRKEINKNYTLISKTKELNHKFIPSIINKNKLDTKFVLETLDVDYDNEFISLIESKLADNDISHINHVIDKVRDLSIESYKIGAVDLAIDLMEIAFKERPNGLFIKNKLAEFKKNKI